MDWHKNQIYDTFMEMVHENGKDFNLVAKKMQLHILDLCCAGEDLEDFDIDLIDAEFCKVQFEKCTLPPPVPVQCLDGTTLKVLLSDVQVDGLLEALEIDENAKKDSSEMEWVLQYLDNPVIEEPLSPAIMLEIENAQHIWQQSDASNKMTTVELAKHKLYTTIEESECRVKKDAGNSWSVTAKLDISNSDANTDKNGYSNYKQEGGNADLMQGCMRVKHGSIDNSRRNMERSSGNANSLKNDGIMKNSVHGGVSVENDSDDDELWRNDRSRLRNRGSLNKSWIDTSMTNSVVHESIVEDDESNQRVLMKKWADEIGQLKKEDTKVEADIEKAEKERREEECTQLLRNIEQEKKLSEIDAHGERVMENLRNEQEAELQAKFIADALKPKHCKARQKKNLTAEKVLPSNSQILNSNKVQKAKEKHVNNHVPLEANSTKETQEQEAKARIEQAIFSKGRYNVIYDANIAETPQLRNLPKKICDAVYSGTDKQLSESLCTICIDCSVIDFHTTTLLLAVMASAANNNSNVGFAKFFSCQVLGLLYTVTTQAGSEATLLPPQVDDPQVKNVIYVCFQSSDCTEANIQHVLNSKKVVDILPPNATKATDSKKLSDFICIVKCVQVQNAKDNVSNDLTSVDPLHLFLRVPSFHLFPVQRPSQNTGTCVARILREKEKVNVVELMPSNSVCVFQKDALYNADILPALLEQGLRFGIDMVGLRMVHQLDHETKKEKKMIALAVRGYDVVSHLDEVLGPHDPCLAKYTDPNSIRARFGSSIEQNVLCAPQTRLYAKREVAKWFGGRIDVANSFPFSDVTTTACGKIPQLRPCHLLLPNVPSRAVLSLPPDMDTLLLGQVFQTIGRLGFTILAINFMQCAKQYDLKLSNWSGSKLSLILVLVRENASVVLKEALQNMCRNDDPIKSYDEHFSINSELELSDAFISVVSHLPEKAERQILKSSNEKINSFDEERERTIVFAVACERNVDQYDNAENFLLQLGMIMTALQGKADLLAMKVIPKLPHRVVSILDAAYGGRKMILLVLRGVHVLSNVNAIRQGWGYKMQGQIIAKHTDVYKVLSVCFSINEIDTKDTSSQKKYFPPQPNTIIGQCLQSTNNMHDLCCIIVKPEGVFRKLIAVWKRTAREGYDCVGMHMTQLSAHIVNQLYRNCTADTLEEHISYLTSGVSIVMWLKRKNAILKLQELLGPEFPNTDIDCGDLTLRTTFGKTAIQNGYYGTPNHALYTVEAALLGQCVNEISHSNEVATTNRYIKNLELNLFVRANLTLNETICVRIHPKLLLEGSCIDIVQRIIDEKFKIVNLCITTLSKEVIEIFAKLCTLSPNEQCPGKWCILMLQRDNAISRMRTFLGTPKQDHCDTTSLFHRQSFAAPPLCEQYGAYIFASNTYNQAQREAIFFFDELYDSMDQIDRGNHL